MSTLKLMIVASLLAISLPLYAQDTPTLLYEVSGKQLEEPSYLFGTIHLMCPDDIQLSKTLQEKLTASEQLVLELDFDEPGMMQEMQQKVMLSEGQTIRDMMSEEDFALVSQFFQDSLSLPMAALERFSPIALYGVLGMQIMHCQPGSYEASLTQLAQEDEQEVVGLETIDEQVAAFNRIPKEAQVALLTESIRDYEQSADEFRALMDAYQAQDLGRIQEISQESVDRIEGMEQHLLIDRNRAWVPKMEEMMDQTTFFAVGAAHLGGEEGLLNLLEEAGYTVTAVAQ